MLHTFASVENFDHGPKMSQAKVINQVLRLDSRKIAIFLVNTFLYILNYYNYLFYKKLKKNAIQTGSFWRSGVPVC